MGIDRRDFVRLAAALATGALGSACSRQLSPTGQRRLNVNIKGLSLVQRSGNAFTLHFVDATKFDPNQFHVIEHHPYLSVSNQDIDASSTAPSVNDPYQSGRKVFDLKDKTVTLDAGLSGSPDVAFNDDNIGEDLPGDDAHWKSVKYAARLPTLCGATMITDNSKFCGTLTLEHGRLEALKPESQYGRSVVWNFTRKVNGTPQKVVKQALTDTLNCEINAANANAIFNIGSQTAVVKLPATVVVYNLPTNPSTPGMCQGSRPCVDHMALFYQLVDKQWVPDAISDPQPPPPVASSVDPDYCPPGSI